MSKEDPTTVAVSGGFDPLHIGHTRLFKEAADLGDELIVLINNDNWLRDKKGYRFMKQGDRVEIINNLAMVDHAETTRHEPDPDDPSVVKSLDRLDPDVFANGGDRKSGNVPEYEFCENHGIELVFNVGGPKIRSSSKLVRRAARVQWQDLVDKQYPS